MPLIDRLTRAVFILVSLMLMLLAGGVILHAGIQMVTGLLDPDINGRRALLEGVGYVIIAVAVFDVAKYLLEEEVVRTRELRLAGEARRSLTKFLSTIIIAVFLEAIVAVFNASHDPARESLFPVLLLLAGVALIVGLGIYLRLSAAAERTMGGAAGEAEDEARSKAARDDAPQGQEA